MAKIALTVGDLGPEWQPQPDDQSAQVDPQECLPKSTTAKTFVARTSFAFSAGTSPRMGEYQFRVIKGASVAYKNADLADKVVKAVGKQDFRDCLRESFVAQGSDVLVKEDPTFVHGDVHLYATFTSSGTVQEPGQLDLVFVRTRQLLTAIAVLEVGATPSRAELTRWANTVRQRQEDSYT